MKKRILSVLLSVVVATTISSAVPMSVQAETTAVKTAVQLSKTTVQSAETTVQSATTTTTYGSNTKNPGEVAAKDIKEWRDKANENDVLPGWYHFKGEETNWKSIEFWPDKENTMKDYESDKILMTFELWKKSGNTYEKIKEMDLKKEYKQFNFHMDKDTDYYVYLSGVDDCCGNLVIDIQGNIYDTGKGTEIPSNAQQLSASESKYVDVSSSDDIHWLKFTAPEEGRYKITYKDTKNTARLDLLNVSGERLGYWSGRVVVRDGVSYYDLNKGAVCYIACTSFEGATSYNVSIKKITQTDTYLNKEHTFAVRKQTKASTIANAQAQTSIEYLDKFYASNKSFSTRIDHVDENDIAAFKKMAGIITKGCTTDKQKVDAITKWVKNNITYDTNTSSYSTAVFKSRRGDCQGMSSLIADFCRSLGMPAAYASGWKADLTKWTIDDLYHSYDRHKFAGHGWDMIYFDGKWHMYDVLFDNYDVTDANKMADLGYYFCWVEGISIAGNGVDPALIGMEDYRENTITAAYYKGDIVTLSGGLICNRGNDYSIDQDGEVCSATNEESTVGLWSLWMEDLYFPTFASFQQYYPYSDMLGRHDGLYYEDGRKNPESGYNYVNGWIGSGNNKYKYLVDPDSVLRNRDIGSIGGKTYYFDQNGEMQTLNMKTDQYYLYKGELYIKTGASGRIITTDNTEPYLNNSKYEIEYEYIQAEDEEGNTVDGKTLLKIDSDKHTVTTLKPGYVWYTIAVRDKDEGSWITTGDSIMFHITNKDKPTYSYEDSKVSSDEHPKPNVTPSTAPTIKAVSLSKTSYTYDGKVKNPTIKVYNTEGKQLSSKYYTVSKSSGRKNVGKYKYTITFKNGYTGKKTLYFTINPKPTKLTSLKKGSKRFTAKWKKVSAQASGYQIRYSMKSSMAGSKVLTVKNYKTTSKKITRLKKKKKYYVQIRTYKTVSKVKYYSGWSGKKSVVTK